MPEQKGLPVHGYRSQPQSSIDQVNDHKVLEEQLLRVMDSMQQSGLYDSRWLAFARMQIEIGFMALNRAVFQPQRIALPEDGPNA